MSAELSYLQARCKGQAKDFGQEERKRRIRDSLVLCVNHLISLGYNEAAEKLAQDAGINEERFELCDNMSFLRVLIDFEAYYEKQYGIKPKITRVVSKNPQVSKSFLVKQAESQKAKASSKPKSAHIKKSPEQEPEQQQEKTEELIISATPITSAQNQKEKPTAVGASAPPTEKPLPQPSSEAKLLRPVPPQLRDNYGDLTSVIANDIFESNTGVTWDDIVGLAGAKRVLREAVVMPLKYPSLFAGKKLLKPWKGVLLHGPPGTGKTLLAKAVASEGTTFFNISASTIVSKWRGDSEKLVRVLFELARFHAPSTIFIDELDSLMSKRSSTSENEASRRLKTEMLIQMDGLASSNELVFVLAASNFPFDLDPAILRRLEKRILVPLPDFEERREMFRCFLSADISNIESFDDFSRQTEGYSGSDIHLVCKEAAMESFRKLTQAMKEKYGDEYLDKQCDAQLPPICKEDVKTALERTKPSTLVSMKTYEEWQSRFGVV